MMYRGLIVLLGAIALLISVASKAKAEQGVASWYGAESGPRTASGERFDPNGMTCAMRSYRRGQRRVVTVTVLATGKSAACRINDHGPAAWTGKIIDVSSGMAKVLGFYSQGIARVRIE